MHYVFMDYYVEIWWSWEKSKVDFDYVTHSIKQDIIPVFQKSGH